MAVSPRQRARELLNATYELQELVSSQGTHEVYRALDLRDGGAVFVKRLRPELVHRPDELAQFAAQARSLEALAHPCMPRVWLDTDDTGLTFVVQELIEGRSIADLIAAFPQGMPLPLLAAVAVPLVEALALAHEAGVIHGAIDPAHVRLLGPLHDPSAKLVGFDIARPEAFVQDRNYRAPELRTAPARAPSADVFACGVLLFEMLSGALPFRSGTRGAMRLDEIAPQVSRDLVLLTAACLHDLPDQRPADAGALLRRLLACCQLPSRLPAARGQATRPDTVLVSQRVPVPRTSERTRRAQPVLGVAERASGAEPASQRAQARSHESPPPLVSERVRRAPDRPRSAGGAAGLLGAEQASELLGRKRDELAKLAGAGSDAIGARNAQPTAAGTSGSARPSRPSAKPVVSPLSQAQVDALAALRHSYDEQDERDRWVAVLFALLLLLLWSVGMPFFEHSGLANARASFGPKLRIAATGFSIATVVAALHPLVATAGRYGGVQRLRGAVMQAAAFGFVFITASTYSAARSVIAAASYGQRWLAWGVGLGLLLLALEHVLRGMRSVAHDARYAALVFGIALLSGFGSYQAVLRALEADRVLARAARESPPSEAAAHGGESAAQNTSTPGGDSAHGAPQEVVGERGTSARHSGRGDHEANDLAPAQEVTRSHEHNAAAAERLRNALP